MRGAVATTEGGTAGRWRAAVRLTRWAAGPIPSLVDQVLNSLQSLIISASLIKMTGPATFGQFVYIFTLVMIAASFQNGLVGIPALVHVAARARDERDGSISTLIGVDRLYRLAAAGVIVLASLAVTRDPVVLAGASAFCFAHLTRETARNILFATGRGARAPLIGIIAFAVFLPVFFLLLWSGYVLLAPFAACAAGITTALLLVQITDVRPVGGANAFRWLAERYRSFFPGLSWRLMQSASNEVQTRSHVFVISALRGVDQAGLLEAGRILWAPLVVFYQAWQKVAQPKLAEVTRAGDRRSAILIALGSVAALVVVGSLYATIVLVFWDHLDRTLFRSFADVLPFAVAWLAYTLALLANWMLIALLNAQLRFRLIAIAGATSAVGTIGLLCAMLLPVPLVTAVWILASVQALQFTVFVGLALRRAPAGDRS